MRYVAAAKTDVGRKRQGNEDSFCLAEDLGLYVVADGMGGHAAGEVASRLAVETIRDTMGRIGGHDWQARSPRRLAGSEFFCSQHPEGQPGDLRYRQRSGECAGMGTTVAAALAQGDRFSWRTSVTAGSTEFEGERSSRYREIIRSSSNRWTSVSSRKRRPTDPSTGT
jgi:serine/threonine protein phosphatase PrpC